MVVILTRVMGFGFLALTFLKLESQLDLSYTLAMPDPHPIATISLDTYTKLEAIVPVCVAAQSRVEAA